MVGMFGLYGVEINKEEAQDYFLKNIEERNIGLPMLNLALTEFTIYGSRNCSLLQDAMFKEQVTAYMKYKGPLKLQDNIFHLLDKESFTDKLKGVRFSSASLEKYNEDKKNTNGKKGEGKKRVYTPNCLRGIENIASKINSLEGQVIQQEWLIEREMAHKNDDVISFDDEALSFKETEIKEGLRLFRFLAQVATIMESMALNIKNHIYIIEYAMDKYTYLTSSTPRDHLFRKGEIEYLICGGAKETDNLLAVFNRIRLFRYAINTLDSFITNANPEIMTRLSMALSKGLMQTAEDLEYIYQGERINLSPSFPKIKVGYADHLRILMLLCNESIVLDRMRELIQQNLYYIKQNSIDEKSFRGIGQLNTQITINACVEIRLWFIKNNSYMICEEVCMGY